MCGVIGIWTASNHASYFVKRGLSALQHRGQESAGISIINSQNKIITYKNMGLVPSVLSDAVLHKLGKNKFAIGHNRYGTSGNASLDNAQPFYLKQGKYALSIAHNGNIPDTSNLRKELGERKRTLSDTLLVARVLLKKRQEFSSWQETFEKVLPILAGAYNFVALTDDNTLLGMRDPYGIWPLCLGKLGDGWVIASESVALDAIGAEFVRDVAPGEIITITAHGKLYSSFFGETKRVQHSLFEYVYFARPDSFINGRRVRAGREESGRLLGERIKSKGLQLDVVVPIFESGYPAARGVARSLQIPLVDAITTSNYVGRTFIQPGQENRTRAVSGKHNIVPDEIVGKKIVVVDDSAVRLTTSRSLIEALKDAGATEVYFAVASPPVVNRCDLGIDMRNKKHLPAAAFEKDPLPVIEEKVSQLINADAMIYLPIDETTKAFGSAKENFYYTPFGGSHPLRGKQTKFTKRKKQIDKKPKIAIFLSGKGTFVQDIIDGIEQHTLNAQIIGVLSNKEGVYGITRAKKHNLPTNVITFTGKRSDKHARKEYEEKLLAYLKELKPDVLLLSGWLFILGDDFLKELSKLQIVVINHHPALLTSDATVTLATSRGTIPVLRGENVWEETFEKKLPVSGISVHQILPGDSVDIGPVIMKAEVRVRTDDTIDSWRKRMDDTEHLLLPTAIKRVLHVIENKIDVSNGEFQW